MAMVGLTLYQPEASACSSTASETIITASHGHSHRISFEKSERSEINFMLPGRNLPRQVLLPPYCGLDTGGIIHKTMGLPTLLWFKRLVG